MNKYLLDANTFIEAKNRYYSMSICPGYWHWLERANQMQQLESIDFVAEELKSGNDELAKWTKDNPQLFVSCDDIATQGAYALVINFIMELKQFQSNVKDEFLRGADPWLVAKAKATNGILVTHEKYNPDIKRKILIPNLCKQLNVQYLNTFELLERLQACFVLE